MIKKILLLFLVMIFFNFAGVEAGHVSCGQTIYSDTVLDSDLLNCPNDGIIIGASGITLDCNGHVIDGTSSYSNIGISMFDRWDVEIKVRNCNVQDFGWGIWLYSSSNNVLTNNVASNNTFGIWLESSSNNNVLTNNVASDNAVGILLSFASNNTLTNNIASNNDYGIYLYSSSDNILTNNTADSNNYYGIRLYSSSDNILTNNTADSNNYYGIRLYSSSNNTLNQNSMSNNTYNFVIQGYSINDFINFIDTTNTVNSKPIYYLLNNQNTVYDETTNAGFFACINCNNITVKNLNPSGNSHGILFVNTNESSIINNALHSNYNGIYLGYSSNNNILTNNTVNSNAVYGIRLSSASNNNIYNNYFNNTVNVYDDGFNYWNRGRIKGTNIVGGPLIGGNFWSDYPGADTNGDGIGDTNIPYNSNGNIRNGGDYYPLVERKMVPRL